MATALAGEPIPPGAFIGALTRNISYMPSAAQSAARSASHHSSPRAIPNWPMRMVCRNPNGCAWALRSAGYLAVKRAEAAAFAERGAAWECFQHFIRF